MKSLWTANLKKPIFRVMENDISTDVLIIGGGLAGILACYKLNEAGISSTLVEKREICSGTTQNTTAKITYQHNLIYHKIIEKYGISAAKKYYEANKEAFSDFCTLALNYDCDFEFKDNYIYSLSDVSIIKKEAAALASIGADFSLTNETDLPFNIAGAVKNKKQAQIHPLKFLYRISEKLNIYEHTFVTKIKNNTAYTDKGKISAKKIIIATHFPFINKHGMYSAKMFQNRSYVLALSGAPDLNGMYLDESKSGYSFRNYKNWLLIGGGNHRTGKTNNDIQILKNFAVDTFPSCEIKYIWAAQDCISLDEVPYIGQYSILTPDIYTITGFNKWGFTSAMLASSILCDKLTGNNNIHADIFNPSRSMLNKQLFVNSINSAADFLSFSTKRCPHLGCALKYNKAEHSWDCPCHGTRINNNGYVLDNPANKQ